MRPPASALGQETPQSWSGAEPPLMEGTVLKSRGALSLSELPAVPGPSALTWDRSLPSMA